MSGGRGASGAHAGDEKGQYELPVDRRLARSVHTRTVIMRALIDLIDAGHPRPTTRQVAARAGVSVRSIYNHFSGVELLFCCAAEFESSQYRDLIAAIPTGGPLTGRIRAIGQQRRQLFEAIGPLLQQSYSRTPRSSRLDELLAHHRALLRGQIATVLAPEIKARGAQAPVLLEALDVATGWRAWSALRSDAGHSAEAAEQIIVYWVSRLLR